jgi:catechol 2,3-dioxygenase-like lactoylglutathione lyase family enzyme
MFEIGGVHHVAIGVKNAEGMKAFYTGILGFKIEPRESPPAPQAVMSGITRGIVPVFAASMLSLGTGGILVEFIQMETPSPKPLRKDFHYGDIGVNKMTIIVPELEAVQLWLQDKTAFCSAPESLEIPGWGIYSYLYCRDPEGNLIEFASSPELQKEGGLGGVASIGIGVTDLERSLAFYQKYTGFDTVLIKTHECLSGPAGGNTGDEKARVRSCVLSSSLGGGRVELFESLAPRGKSIPSYTMWGDFGYLQTCLLCKNVPEIAGRCEKEELEFALNLQQMPGEEAAFIYIRDPDGIILEFLSFSN